MIKTIFTLYETTADSSPESYLLQTAMTAMASPFIDASLHHASVDEMLKVTASVYPTDLHPDAEATLLANAWYVIAKHTGKQADTIKSIMVKADNVAGFFYMKFECEEEAFVTVMPASDDVMKAFRQMMLDDDLFTEEQFKSDSLFNWFQTNMVSIAIASPKVDRDFGGNEHLKDKAVKYVAYNIS